MSRSYKFHCRSEYKNIIHKILEDNETSIFVYNEIAPEYPALIVDLVDAFPVAISDIGLNWGSSDFMRLNVRFNFLTWNERNVGISGGGSSVSTINSNLQVNDPNRQQQTANDTKIASTGRTSVSGQSVVQGSTMDGFAPP